MGSVNRSDAIVDERLKVKGIKNVNVIDTLIMPEIPNSNTNEVTVVIGEFGFDMIIVDHILYYIHCV